MNTLCRIFLFHHPHGLVMTSVITVLYVCVCVYMYVYIHMGGSV